MQDALQSQHCARQLRALAEPERLRIIQCLRDGPRNVSEIADLLDSPVVTVSHHLGVLRHAGLVHDQKQGRYVIYRLADGVLRPAKGQGRPDHLDLGCCRLEIPLVPLDQPRKS